MNKEIYVTHSSMPSYEEYITMIKPLWDTARLTNMGKYHKELEIKLKSYLGVPYISLMTNGHMALEMALQAMNLTGEVITTPFSFVSTVHAIVRNGLKPVFCDINPQNYTMDVDKIEELITEQTSAIVPVHVYGQVCNVEQIEKIAQKYHLKVVYDAAHAFGVTKDGKSILNWGDASILSFHATKVFHTAEGGAVVFHNEEYGRALYGLKNFGIRDEITIDAIGSNAKMDELRAAMGLCNLKYLEENIVRRKTIVNHYRELLKKVEWLDLLKEQDGVKSNYAYFPIIIKENQNKISRDNLYTLLKEKGIFTRKYFYPLLSQCECYKEQFKNTDLSVAENIAERVLTLPLYAELSLSDVERICNYIISYFQ